MTVPYTFANASGAISLEELDANFSAVGQNVDTANTVIANAQPNITSVGTLTTLSVSGNAVAAYFYGDGSNLSNVVAVSNIGSASQFANGITSLSVPTAGGNILGSVGGAYNIYNFTPNGLLITGNVSASGAVYGNGRFLTSINAANISGVVGVATYATQAGTANTANIAASANSANSAITAITVLANSQPNITSVGTLTTLSVTGSVTGAQFVGAGNTLSNIQAGNITGTVATANSAAYANVANTATLAATVTTAAQPNITSVGVLTSLSVTGTIRAASIVGNISGTITDAYYAEIANTANTATTASYASVAGSVTGVINYAVAAGTVTTNAQPNITSVGTLTTLSVSGNITAGAIIGNITANVSNATVAVTVSNAAQPNITSVGTLSSLSVSGNVIAPRFYGNLNGNVSGNILSSTQPHISTVGTLTALAVDGNVSVAGNVIAPRFYGNLTGNVTGNVTGNGNINANVINGTYVMGNLVTGYTVAGNVVAGYSVVGNNIIGISVSGTSIAAGNIRATGTISATGNVYGNNINNGHAFIAKQTSYQTLASATGNIAVMNLVYDSVSKNIGNCYNSSTGVFTATVPGFYQVSASIGIDISANISAFGSGAVGLFKTGNAIAAGPFVEQVIIGNTWVVSQSSLSTLVYLDISDTLQCKLAYMTNANNWTTQTNLVPSSFEACWLRP